MSLTNLLDLMLERQVDQDGNAPPLQTPVTIIDLERGPCVSMDLPMADPCPACGGHRMQVGDWVCFGTCSRCYDNAMKDAQ